MNLIKQVKNFIISQQLVEQGTTVIAAVSSGIDSMVMAEVLHSLNAELGFSLVVANFNHRLRAEAEEEAEFVAAWAAARNLPCVCGSADIRELSQTGNLQDVARRERYAFLRRVAAEHERPLIATAHHKDDQAETVLLHLLRGTGLRGLCGMSAADNGLIRPLLAVSRAEIAAFAAAKQLEFREDASNRQTKYLRNRVRLELLPQLADYSLQISENLLQLADICRAEDELLSALAAEKFALLWNAKLQSLDAVRFAALPVALQRRLVRLAFAQLGAAGELSFAQVEAVRKLRDEQSCSLPGGWLAYLRGELCFAASKPALPLHKEELPLLADGCWHSLAGWGWRYCADMAKGATELQAGQFLLPMAQAEQAAWRTRRDGDRLGSSKLKELFIEAKLPIHQRNSWPLLVVEGQIAWLPFFTQKSEKQAPFQQPMLLIQVEKCDKI